MILKGSQRANGADLALHLMNGFDNERIEIAEVYGAVAGDLYGAFAEFEAVAAGTKADKYLYSSSISPPASLTREQYYEIVQEIECRLGLTGQPRAVVFHVKDGREHCHAVWSRIDIKTMTAIHLSHDHCKLMDIACEFARKYGINLPPGLKAWEQKQRLKKDKLEASLAERAQQKQTGISPEQRRAEITACYEQADSAVAFRHALEQKGYILARGDRRGFVVVDKFTNVHSLTRYVKGHTAKDIKAKLAPLTPADLPGVDQAKAMVRQRRQAQDEGQRERQRKAIKESQEKAQQTLAAAHAKQRAQLRQKEQELLTRHQSERLSLHAAQQSERKDLLFRMRSAIADLMVRTPGLRSVLAPLQKLTHLDPRERHRLEDAALSRRHTREKRDFARQGRTLSRLQVRERQALQKALRRAARQAQDLEGRVQQDFAAAARDYGVRQDGAGEGDLVVEFNDAAEFAEGAERAGDEDDDRAPGWKARTEKVSRGRRRRRGRGYRRDRDSD